MSYRKSRPPARSAVLFLLLLLFLCTPCLLGASTSHSVGKWTGVDETVVENIAREHGREARKPLIDTDRGDLLPFLFLVAGAIGGFAGGYYWRKLTEQRPTPRGGN
jgi:hypothetical protein